MSRLVVLQLFANRDGLAGAFPPQQVVLHLPSQVGLLQGPGPRQSRRRAGPATRQATPLRSFDPPLIIGPGQKTLCSQLTSLC